MSDPTDPIEPTEPTEPTPDDEAVRRALHDLPDVAPPEGFFEGLIRQRQGLGQGGNCLSCDHGVTLQEAE